MFLENDVISGSNGPQNLVFEERDNIEPSPKTSSRWIVLPDSHQDLIIHEATIVDEPHHKDIITYQVTQHLQQESVDLTLRRSIRERRSAISFYYILCLQEYDIDISARDDHITFSQAMNGSESKLWYEAMNDELNSMANNQVWDLVELPKSTKVICNTLNDTLVVL